MKAKTSSTTHWPAIRRLALLLGAPLLFGASAQQNKNTLEKALNYQTGNIVLLRGEAMLRMPPGYSYLNPSDTKRVLEAWGNPDGSGTEGMILPPNTNATNNDWAVVLSYSNEGYVSDKDASGINYNDLLKQMREGEDEENKERKNAGYQTVHLTGWATPPHYDAKAHKLYWAKEIEFAGEQNHTLNYNVRVLGRRGVLNLNAVSSMDQLSPIEKAMPDVIAFSGFNPGSRYEDFNPSTDKIAEYGLAALIAGGVAAKTGLLAKIGLLLLGAKKLLIPIGIAVVGFFAKLFGRKAQDA